MSEVPNPRDRQQWPPRRPEPPQEKMTDGEYWAVWGGLAAALIILLAIWSFFTFVFPSIAAWFLEL